MTQLKSSHDISSDVQTIEYTYSEILMISDSTTMALPQGKLRVEISSGEAWISRRNTDIFVPAGKTAELDESPFPSLISSSNPRKTLVFRVVKC